MSKDPDVIECCGWRGYVREDSSGTFTFLLWEDSREDHAMVTCSTGWKYLHHRSAKRAGIRFARRHPCGGRR